MKASWLYSADGSWPNHVRKLHRARYHLQQLKTEIRNWLKGSHHHTWLEPHPRRSDYLVVKAEADKIPEDPFSMLIGDVAQNYRACLDYVAFELGARHPKKFTERAKRDSQFPVIGCVNKYGESKKGFELFKARNPKDLAAVDPRAKTIIKRAQPYYRRSAFRSHWLWRLDELATVDKHRLLHLTVAYPQTWTLHATSRMGKVMRWKGAEVTRIVISGLPVSQETVIGRLRIRRNAEMDVALHVEPSIGFAGRVRGEPDVMGLFESIDIGVVTLVDALRRRGCL